MAKRGRKPFIEEMEIKTVANLAMRTVKALLMRDDLTADQQIKLAVPLMLKRMPDKIQHEGMNQIFQLILPMIERNKQNRLNESEAVSA